MKKITIKDVAKRAGVSISTVSRVINGNYPVSKTSRDKVNKAVKEMNFSPNLLAKALSSDKSNTISVIVPTIENAFFSETIKGIRDVLDENSYTFFLGISDSDPKKELELLEKSEQRKVDGYILIDPSSENVNNKKFEKFSNIVLINSDKNINCDIVSSDTNTLFKDMIKKFVNEGFKNIIFLTGDNSYSYTSKEKIFSNFSFPEGVKTDIIRIKGGNDISTVEETEKVMDEYLKKNTKYAILSCNDLMAVGSILSANKIGIKIPDDLSIVGIDNSIYSKIIKPTLSTIDHNSYHLGKTASNRLLELIDNKELIKQKIIINSNFIERNSTLWIKWLIH